MFSETQFWPESTMSSSNLWISLFIEHCLSSYETEGEGHHVTNLNWEDDGSNLRFPTSIQQYARINSWHERNDVPIANLTDSDTQIDAFLSRESLEEYNKAFPARPLSKDGCRGYFIQLVNFELVYEYSTGKPKVHLYVKRFTIVWERDRVKAPPAGKSVGKKPSLATLIRRVFSSIKSRGRQNEKGYSSTADSNDYGDIPATQAVNGHEDNLLQAQFVSQLPPKASLDRLNPGPEHDTAPSARLLEHLEQAKAAERLLSRERSAKARLPNRGSVPQDVRHRSTSRLSTTRNERHSSPEAPRQHPQAKKANVPVDETPKPQLNSTLPSPQKPTGEAISRTNTGSRSLESAADGSASPYSPDKQLEANLQASQNVTFRRNDPKKATPSTIDPWEGMTGIRSIDVTVPKDQEELLGYDKKPWYPPPVGEPRVSGHVPPALLHEWNTIVARRNQAEDTRSKSPEDRQVTDPGTPTTESSSDAEEESEKELDPSWKATPQPSPHRQLPADSSPVRGASVSQNPRRIRPGDRKDNKKNIGSGTHSTMEENYTVSEVGQDHDPSNPPEAPEAINNVNEDDGHESDDSSDSEMSVVIPQPLTGSTQQGIPSQAEAGVSSSGPPLPESASQNIQVVETPAATLNKTLPAIISGDDFGEGRNAEPSSQADKSSSHSRILNTYATHEGDSREWISQESSKSLPVAGADSNHVHLRGTSYSSEPFPTQPTPWSGSNPRWNSSGLKSIEASVSAASTYHSQSSKAFSYYRDIPPSSMLSVEEHRSPSIQSSARGTPSRNGQPSPLKRFASEIGADSEHGSPSKRAKVERQPTMFKLETGLDDEIISRRQTYIINSAQSVEASRVYEKFRNDYPSYVGTFAHFSSLCSRLQTFREDGSLQRSFLWDDFIIKNLEDYPTYFGGCIANEKKPLKYEEYFASSFSKPTNKKRSLTVEGISACAAQFITIDESPTDMSSVPMTDANTSFTGSLRDQLDNFHTYSFAVTQGPLSQDRESPAGQSDTDLESASEYSIPDSEPARVAAQEDNEGLQVDNTAPEIVIANAAASIDEDEEMEDVDDTIHETASVELGDDEPAVPVLVPVKVPVSKPMQNELFTQPATESPASDADIDSDGIDEVVTEIDNEDRDDSVEDEFDHGPDDTVTDEDNAEISTQEQGDDQAEVMSEDQDTIQDQLRKEIQVQIQDQLEDDLQDDLQSEFQDELQVETLAKLQDEPPNPQTSTQTHLETQPSNEPNPDPEETEPEPDLNENWFLSLRHIYPPSTSTDPVWSDDPNTPFKKWARADQDVLSVRSRRGGARVSVDEKGVIQRMT
ncbi:hypothetical protein BDV12DRAFT_164237 [Aspergillus spectabilis]